MKLPSYGAEWGIGYSGHGGLNKGILDVKIGKAHEIQNSQAVYICKDKQPLTRVGHSDAQRGGGSQMEEVGK